jgi:hypothetical protein
MASKDRKNDTEDKNNNNFPDVIGSIDKYLGIILKTLPLLGLLATLSLYHYAREVKVDVFSHYSSWISILPVIAVAETFIGVLVIIYLFGPVFFIDLLNRQYKENKSCNRGRPGQCIGLVFAQYIYLVFIPVLLAYGSVSNEYVRQYLACVGQYWYFWMPVYVLVFVLCNYFFVNKIKSIKASWNNSWENKTVTNSLPGRIKRKIFLFSLSLVVAIIVPFISIIGAKFFLDSIYYSSQSVDQWGLIIWATLSLFCVILSGILYLYSWDDIAVKWFSSVIFMVSLGYMLVTPFSARISIAALRVLDVGGGVERVYYVNVDDKSKPPIPSWFVDYDCCVDGFCLTKGLSIKWGVGDLIYVSLLREKNEKLKQSIALPRNILLPYDMHTGMPESCMTQTNYILAKLRK